MKSILIKTALTLLCINAICQAAQVKTMTVYFEKDKAYLTNGEAAKLTQLRSADFVALKGHTDNDGDDAYNVALSKKRVEAVKAVVQNIDPGIKLETDYFGERSPLNNNTDEKEKTLNRRVEITYVSDPLMRIHVPEQHYEIDNNKDQVITCKNGTQVYIPAGAFDNNCVTISVSEFYGASEIFAANLSTRNDKTPIETAGMINITVETDGHQLQPLKPLQYKFPREKKEEDFGLFAGVRDSSLGMNWKLRKMEQPGAAAKAPKEGYTELKGWDSCETLSSGPFSAYLQGKGMDSFWIHVKFADTKLIKGCLADGAADITLNKEGKIVLLKTKYQGKNNAWDTDLKKFIRSYFPNKIETYDCGANIHLKFGRYNTASIITNSGTDWTGGGPWYYNIGKEYCADYETDKIVLTTSQMGWINCDRFMSDVRLTTYKVQTDTDANVRLMVKNYRSFFANEFTADEAKQHKRNKEVFGFYKIPDNEEVVLICTKKVDGIIYLAIEPTKVSNELFKITNYKAVTQEELETAIRDLTI